MGWLDFLKPKPDPRDKQIEGLTAQLKTCNDNKVNLIESYTSCLTEKTNIAVACGADKMYLADRINNLTSIIAASIQLPDISEYVDSPVEINPNELIALHDYQFADDAYYGFTKLRWEQLLLPIQKQVKRQLKYWRTNIADCDEWALVMAGFVASTFATSGLDKQGAFAIAWGKAPSAYHAYNLFVDKDSNIWLYEPQTGKTLEKISDENATYRTDKVWLMGSKAG